MIWLQENVCKCFFRSEHIGEGVLQLAFPDEAWFSLSGEVNYQNNPYCNPENCVLIHCFPFRDENMGVWRVIRACRVIGPTF